MQATVSRFDPQTRSGAVLLDTGVELPFSPAATAAAQVRLFRPGQRVRIATTGSGETLAVTAVHFSTLP